LLRRYSAISLSAVLLLVATALEGQPVFFSEAEYTAHTGPLPANQVNFPPIVLTAGDNVFEGVPLEDIQLRCSVYTGTKGVQVSGEGSFAEGDDLDIIGTLPDQSAKTKKNGWAVLEWLATDVTPPLGSSGGDLSAVLLEFDLAGGKEVMDPEIQCTLGVPGPPSCVPDGETACFHNGRFSGQVFEYNADGTLRPAQVFTADPDSALFFFPGTNIDVLMEFLDKCAEPSEDPNAERFGFRFRTPPVQGASTTPMIWVRDHEAGVTRRAPASILDDNRDLHFFCP
jgi:hypothetical protein